MQPLLSGLADVFSVSRHGKRPHKSGMPAPTVGNAPLRPERIRPRRRRTPLRTTSRTRGSGRSSATSAKQRDGRSRRSRCQARCSSPYQGHCLDAGTPRCTGRTRPRIVTCLTAAARPTLLSSATASWRKRRRYATDCSRLADTSRGQARWADLFGAISTRADQRDPPAKRVTGRSRPQRLCVKRGCEKSVFATASPVLPQLSLLAPPAYCPVCRVSPVVI